MSGGRFRQHDAALAMTKATIEIYQPLLRQEEVGDAIDEVYAAVRAGLIAYEAARAHIQHRLKPMNN